MLLWPFLKEKWVLIRSLSPKFFMTKCYQQLSILKISLKLTSDALVFALVFCLGNEFENRLAGPPVLSVTLRDVGGVEQRELKFEIRR